MGRPKNPPKEVVVMVDYVDRVCRLNTSCNTALFAYTALALHTDLDNDGTCIVVVRGVHSNLSSSDIVILKRERLKQCLHEQARKKYWVWDLVQEETT